MDTIFKMKKYLKKHSKLLKRVLVVLSIFILIVGICSTVYYKKCFEERTNAYQQLFDEQVALKSENHNLKNDNYSFRQLVNEKNDEIEKLKEQVAQLEQKLGSNKVTKPQVNTIINSSSPDPNYTQANKVWNHLKSYGLNDYVCAGIMGNIMAEVGGQTLDISRWPTYSQGTYYGICQWAGSRKDRLLNDFGTSLEAQLNFLTTELFEIIPKGNAFYSMDNAEDAALYFAKYYERCNSKYYSIRQKNAVTAYNYFVG
jgi:hypothetical protein